MRFALPINQFATPSQMGRVTSKCRQEGKNVRIPFGWILESMIAVEKKKDLIDQFFYLQRSEQRPRELIELAQGHEAEQ